MPRDTPPHPQPAYDWDRFGRHRLRAPDGAIVDVPVAASGVRAAWVATLWPDAEADDGWSYEQWPVHERTGRGWRLPTQLAGGDVLEFGADTPAGPVRWYGIMDSYEVDRWATVQGPYPSPAAAYDDAQRLLAIERFLPAIESDSQNQPKPRHHSRRDRSRRHRR